MDDRDFTAPLALSHWDRPAGVALPVRGRQVVLVLFRVRYANFRHQSMALYRRYAHVIAIFLSLFGLLLTERPGVLAAPLLQFWRAPDQWRAGLACAGGWLCVVTIWASIHRECIRGEPLATYSRSLPLAAHTGALVNLALLYVSLQIFLLPFAVALWVAVRSGHAGGADGRFFLYLTLFAALTVSAAKSTVFGSSLRARLVLAGGAAALVFSPQLPGRMLSLAVLASALCFCIVDAATPPPDARRIGRAGRAARHRQSQLPLPLLRLQCALLAHRHRHAAVTRLLLAALPQLASWWLIVAVGKTADAHVFIQLACALTASLTAGFFYTFFVAKGALQPYLRSIAFGTLRMALAEQLLVLSATAVVFGVSLSMFAIALGPHAAATAAMLRASLYWLAWLPLLGLPLIQRHKDGILMKFALVIVALLIAFN